MSSCSNRLLSTELMVSTPAAACCVMMGLLHRLECVCVMCWPFGASCTSCNEQVDGTVGTQGSLLHGASSAASANLSSRAWMCNSSSSCTWSS